MGLPAKLSITNSNYTSFKKEDDGRIILKDIESWVTLRQSEKIQFKNGGLFSRDAGIKVVTNFEGEQPDIKVTPAFEAKYRQKLTDNEKINLSAGGRARISDELQFRGFAGANYKVTDKLSVSADLHYTIGTSNLFDSEKPTKTSQKAGEYLSLSYKATPHLNIWCDPVQVNYNITKNCWEVFPNGGLSYKF